MNCFAVTALPLSGLNLVKRRHIGDKRGFLSRLFCAEELASFGWTKPVAQINHTYSAKRGTVRGLHFQHAPYTEMKLVTCIRGEVWDVVVDARANSPTYLEWHAEILSAANGHALLVPDGFAHGFQAITDDVELIYCHTAIHAPNAEGGLNPLDPRLQINWPLSVAEISVRDAGHPMIDATFKGVRV